MLAYFLLGLAALMLVCVIHPFTTYPASLWLMKRLGMKAADLPRRPIGPAGKPGFVLCVSAYNEEGVIRDKVENCLALRRRTPDLDILFYVDAAFDRTAEILQEYGNAITLVIGTERRGKSHGMNELVSRAGREIIVFSDANVMIDSDALERLRHHFADAAVGCVCGHLRYANSEATPTAEVGAAYWRLEEFVKQAESDLGSVMGADGSLFAIRRGLHQPVAPDIIDDFFLSMSVLASGYRIIRGADVQASEQSATSSSEEFRRKVRIACQAFNVHRLIWPQLSKMSLMIRYMYVSHKLLRWFSGFTLLFGLIAGFVGLALVIGWFPMIAMTIVGILLAGLGKTFGMRPLPQLYEIVSAFVANAVGVVRSLRGERFQTWTPAASVRSVVSGGLHSRPDSGPR